MSKFILARRQSYIDEGSYFRTLQHYISDEAEYEKQLLEPDPNPGGHASTYKFRASSRWEAFQLKYTGGEPLSDLAVELEKVVEGYEDYVTENSKKSDEDYHPPFIFDDLIDTYVRYLNLLSAAVLLHREDLVPRIFGLIEGGILTETMLFLKNYLGSSSLIVQSLILGSGSNPIVNCSIRSMKLIR